MRFFSSALTLLFACSLFIQSGIAQEASWLIERAQLQRGLCCVLGAGDGTLPLALARSSQMLIHVRDSSADAVQQIRQQADAAGFSIQRVVAEKGDPGVLPHADNTLDLLISSEPHLLDALKISDVLRALRPEGVAILGGAGAADALRTLTTDVEGAKLWSDSHGDWVQFSKPVPAGLDEWSHWEKSPDNNPVSEDMLIKAPYMTQFMAKPWYIGMPAVTTAAGGRTFLAMGHIAHHKREWGALNRLIARNGYNGTVLWERQLPEDYLVHRSAFVATKDTFYMMNGDHCLLLDARTGEEREKISISGVPGDWKWMALSNGVLYVLAGAPGDGVELVKGTRAFGGWSWADLSKGYYGKRIPHGFGDVLVAYDLEHKTVLWQHNEESLIDSRGLAIRDDQFFLYCPDRHFRALDCETGEVRWTNGEEETLTLIEQPGKGLTSTPGWRTQTLVVATPESLVVQGQTRMNVVGISTDDGSLLWHKPKVTNNPNAIYVDNKVIIGIGERGRHLVIDPKTGNVENYLSLVKVACTRLTASTDSFFARGEGMTRFDRASGAVQIDGAVRPACNDGVIPAHGLIYLGPWACDCNLALIGNVARCSAGDFQFDYKAKDEERLEVVRNGDSVQAFEIHDGDWPMYRSNLRRSASTAVPVQKAERVNWYHEPDRAFVPTDLSAASGLVFLGGEDGKVRAIDGETGKERWSFQTAGPVKYPPSLWDGRAYVGSADGFAYCLEAATGQLLWRFRAAPVERHIMIYDSLSSTWPVNTGVLVHDGVAYFGAGIVDHDGTFIYAVDAGTGQMIWENTTSGHLNPELRKGISVQGNLTILDDMLVMAGGNVVSPARFDLRSGKCLESSRKQGNPQANGGKFVGVLGENTLVAGGRILYSSPRNVSTKGAFAVWSSDRQSMRLNYGGIPPAWNDEALAVANYKYGRITSLSVNTLTEKIQEGLDAASKKQRRRSRNLVSSLSTRGNVRWQSNLGDSSEFESLSVALASNAVVAVARYQSRHRAVPQFFLTGLNSEDGDQMFQMELPAEPLPGGLIVDRNGHVMVAMLDGGVVCFGP
ncbi:MAG: PQQ-binding-like beta-propeller repeat protein [Fuerstiella sp.]|nr:PQQ-binding-like beta-propeller repeat protein [Fuerstiella sp.]